MIRESVMDRRRREVSKNYNASSAKPEKWTNDQLCKTLERFDIALLTEAASRIRRLQAEVDGKEVAA